MILPTFFVTVIKLFMSIIVEIEGCLEYRGDYQDSGDISVNFKSGKIYLKNNELDTGRITELIFEEGEAGEIVSSEVDYKDKMRLISIIKSMTNDKCIEIIKALSAPAIIDESTMILARY